MEGNISLEVNNLNEYFNIKNDQNSFWMIALNSGYLTKQDYVTNNKFVIPNHEVEIFYYDIILKIWIDQLLI